MHLDPEFPATYLSAHVRSVSKCLHTKHTFYVSAWWTLIEPDACALYNITDECVRRQSV